MSVAESLSDVGVASISKQEDVQFLFLKYS